MNALTSIETASRTEVLALRLASVDLHGRDKAHLFRSLLQHQAQQQASSLHAPPSCRQLVRVHTRSLRLLQDAWSPLRPLAPVQALERALYDAAASTSAFEKDLLGFPLHLFEQIEQLHLESAPQLLTCQSATQQATALGRLREAGLRRVRANLRDLVCMLSLWGRGDSFEELWQLAREGTTSPCSGDATQAPKDEQLPRMFRRPAERAFGQLTHLQLHGPRMRFTPSTALALAELPVLSHLALVLPRFLSQDVTSGAALYYRERLVHAHDALGRFSVLQVLVNTCIALRELRLIGHAEAGYTGNVVALPALVAAIQRRPYHRVQRSAWQRSNDEDEAEEQPLPDLRIHVVAARRRSTKGPHDRTHPTYFSRWMYARACADRHWALLDQQEDDDEEARRVDALWDIDVSVDTIVLAEQRSAGADLDPEVGRQSPAPQALETAVQTSSPASEAAFMLEGDGATDVD